MDKFILWNARSVLNKKANIKYLIYKENPGIIAITETWLKEKDKFTLNNYTIIRKDRINQIGGGIAICIRNVLQFKEIKIRDRYNDKVEVLGLKVNYKNKWLNILILYNPCNDIKTEEFLYYTDQITEPKLIIGDFNAHHTSWNPNLSQNHTNKTGKSLFEVITENNIMLLTPPGQITRIDPKNAKGSTLDLILASPTLSHLEIETGPNIGSDHLPIIVKDKTIQKSPQSKEKK